MDAKSWSRASGRIELEGDMDLAKVSSLVPRERMPVDELRGQLIVSAAVGRDNPKAPVEVRLGAYSRGLVLTGKTPSEEPIPKRPRETAVTGVAPWRSDDVDFGLDIRNDTSSGFTEVAFRLTDREGIVTTFDAKSDIPYAELFADPSRARELLSSVPISASLLVPKRSFDRMPNVLRTKNVSGTVEGQVVVRGTPLEPVVEAVAHARDFRTGAIMSRHAGDADLAMKYDGNAADLAIDVRSENEKVLALNTHVDAKAKDFFESGPGRPPAWSARTKLALSHFPLDSIGTLADWRVRGRVSAEATLEGLHVDPKFSAHLGFEGLGVGRARYKAARFDIDAAGGKLVAKARVEQSDGFADASAESGIVWGTKIVPALAEDKPIEARLDAKAFRAAAIAPFVRGIANAIDGRIDGQARVSISPATKEAKLQGRLALNEATWQLPIIGEEFRDGRATIVLSPDGTLKIDDIFARSTEGEVSAYASAKLRGLSLESADASVSIPDKRPVDVAVNGQPVGQVSGKAKVNAKPSDDGKTLAVAVDVPQCRVELPQALKTGVQELDGNPNIRVGVYRNANMLVRLPLSKEDFDRREEPDKDGTHAEETVANVDVRLAKVVVRRGNTLEATLSGNPKVAIDGGESRITGQVKVDRGWAEVQGKKFDVEKGTITFNGEVPPNPVVVATATWKSGGDTQVFADFVGPVKTGKLNLRSEPALPQNEILALVLFGAVDATPGAPPPAGREESGTQQAAVGIGGALAAQGLTEALDDLAGIHATARIDTTEARNPRPEVEFQISSRVAVAFSHVIGTPPVTDPPDRNLVRIQWRFHSNWSVESVSGDRGRQLFDLIWQKRY
jgi:translocation and assembly module TamB